MRRYGEECVEPRHQNVDHSKQDILHRRKNTEQRKMADLERNNENEQNISHNNQNKSSKCCFLDFCLWKNRIIMLDYNRISWERIRLTEARWWCHLRGRVLNLVCRAELFTLTHAYLARMRRCFVLRLI